MNLKNIASIDEQGQIKQDRNFFIKCKNYSITSIRQKQNRLKAFTFTKLLKLTKYQCLESQIQNILRQLTTQYFYDNYFGSIELRDDLIYYNYFVIQNPQLYDSFYYANTHFSIKISLWIRKLSQLSNDEIIIQVQQKMYASEYLNNKEYQILSAFINRSNTINLENLNNGIIIDAFLNQIDQYDQRDQLIIQLKDLYIQNNYIIKKRYVKENIYALEIAEIKKYMNIDLYDSEYQQIIVQKFIDEQFMIEASQSIINHLVNSLGSERIWQLFHFLLSKLKKKMEFQDLECIQEIHFSSRLINEILNNENVAIIKMKCLKIINFDLYQINRVVSSTAVPRKIPKSPSFIKIKGRTLKDCKDVYSSSSRFRIKNISNEKTSIQYHNNKKVRTQGPTFSCLGPSRSAQSIMARNQYLNGNPPSPKQKITVSRNLTQFMRDLKINNLRSKDLNQQSQRKDEIIEDQLNTSIQHSGSPILPIGSTQRFNEVDEYLGFKKSLVKQALPTSNKLLIYKKALWNMIIKNDQNELMDFDNRYYRVVRQKRLGQTIRFLINRSKELQISLQDLIDNNMTIHKAYQQQGSYAFLYAVKRGLIQQVEELLIKNNLYVYDFNEKQMTALHIAVIKQNKQMIQLLLRFNANILIKDLQNFTPLSYAVQNSDIETIKQFLDLQCPSDYQYAYYLKLTRNSQIHDLIRQAKLVDIKIRTIHHPQIQSYINRQLSLYV